MEFDIAMLALRVGVGVVFTAHGLQKLFGWWGGPGWAGWSGWIGSMGLRPAGFWASISLLAELGGGLALIFGFLVPLAAAGLVAQALVLMWRVHRPSGFWNHAGGIEFPIVLLTGAFALQLIGPGAWALDSLIPAVDVLYEPTVSWAILGLAALGALVAALWPLPQPHLEAATQD